MGDKAAYIASLEKQHAEIDKQVIAMQKSPACCGTQLREQKKEKLRLKEAIERAQTEDEDPVPDAPVLQVLEGDSVSPTIEPPLFVPDTAVA